QVQPDRDPVSILDDTTQENITVAPIIMPESKASFSANAAVVHVTDPSGAEVSNARISLTDEVTKQTFQVTTGGVGADISSLPRGTYYVTVTANGFETKKLSHVALPAGLGGP